MTNAGKRLHPACHTSESQPCLSTEWGRDGKTEKGKTRGELSSLFFPSSPHLHHTGASETITHPPLSLAQGCALPVAALPTCILRKGQNKQAARLLPRKAVHYSTLPVGYNPRYMVKDYLQSCPLHKCLHWGYTAAVDQECRLLIYSYITFH